MRLEYYFSVANWVLTSWYKQLDWIEEWKLFSRNITAINLQSCRQCRHAAEVDPSIMIMIVAAVKYIASLFFLFWRDSAVSHHPSLLLLLSVHPSISLSLSLSLSPSPSRNELMEYKGCSKGSIDLITNHWVVELIGMDVFIYRGGSSEDGINPTSFAGHKLFAFHR